MLQENSFSFHYNPPEKWMSFIPDNIPINKLRIPGTHNSGSGICPSKKIVSKIANFAAHCHTLDIPTQLKRGIRYIDIRLKLEPNEDLYIHHKVVRYDTTFLDVLNIISSFFDENPKECIMIRIHREDGDPGSKFYRKDVTDKMFVDCLVANLQEFSEKERNKRLAEREQIHQNNNDNNSDNIHNSNQNAENGNNEDEYLNAIYNEENDNPLLGNVRRKIILFGVFHIAHVELLRNSPFKFREINKQAEYKFKCKENDIEKKMNFIIEGFQKSKSEELQNNLFVNEINAVGSIPVFNFIPDPKKMAGIMNNMVESILIQLIKDKTNGTNSSDNAVEESNDVNSNNNSNQIENDNIRNDFQGVLMFDFPEISNGGKLIELVYAQNDFL